MRPRKQRAIPLPADVMQGSTERTSTPYELAATSPRTSAGEFPLSEVDLVPTRWLLGIDGADDGSRYHRFGNWPKALDYEFASNTGGTEIRIHSHAYRLARHGNR